MKREDEIKRRENEIFAGSRVGALHDILQQDLYYYLQDRMYVCVSITFKLIDTEQGGPKIRGE